MIRSELINAIYRYIPEDMVVQIPTEEEYEKIEYVYLFYPFKNKDNPKKLIAELYINFGMEIIHDMTPRAKEAEKKRKVERDSIYNKAQRPGEQGAGKDRNGISEKSNAHERIGKNGNPQRKPALRIQAEGTDVRVENQSDKKQ